MVPNSSEPPVNTPAGVQPPSRSSSTYDRWWNVWPGVPSTRSRMVSETGTVSPSETGVRSNSTVSAAATRYCAPVIRASSRPPET